MAATRAAAAPAAASTVPSLRPGAAEADTPHLDNDVQIAARTPGAAQGPRCWALCVPNQRWIDRSERRARSAAGGTALVATLAKTPAKTPSKTPGRTRAALSFVDGAPPSPRLSRKRETANEPGGLTLLRPPPRPPSSERGQRGHRPRLAGPREGARQDAEERAQARRRRALPGLRPEAGGYAGVPSARDLRARWGARDPADQLRRCDDQPQHAGPAGSEAVGGGWRGGAAADLLPSEVASATGDERSSGRCAPGRGATLLWGRQTTCQRPRPVWGAESYLLP